MKAQSLIVQSGKCPVKWLCRTLRPSFFGGSDCVIFVRPSRDVRVVRLDRHGRDVTGVA